MWTDLRDIIHDMLKSIDEHALILQNNLHYQFCPQALCYNLPVLQLAPTSPIQGRYSALSFVRKRRHLNLVCGIHYQRRACMHLV